MIDIDTLDSIQLYEYNNYIIWITPYDNRDSIWISDNEGYEIITCDSISKAFEYIDNILKEGVI